MAGNAPLDETDKNIEMWKIKRVCSAQTLSSAAGSVRGRPKWTKSLVSLPLICSSSRPLRLPEELAPV